MEFRELKYICTVAEYGSFTKAANALYITQPSLSHMVARTEERLGVLLFDRSTQPLKPTYAGEVYLRYAQEILAADEMMEREFRDISHSKKGRLRIGFPYERAAYMLPEIVPRFRREFPEIQLELQDAGGKALQEMIQRGRIDFAVYPLLSPVPGLESQLLYEEELLLSAAPEMILPSDYLDGDPRTVNFFALKDKPFILQRGGHVVRDVVDLLLGAYHIKPHIAMEVSGNMAAYRLSCAGLGVAIIPELTVRLARIPSSGALYHLAGDIPVKWEVRAIYRKDTYIGEVETRFFQIAQDVFNRPHTLIGTD